MVVKTESTTTNQGIPVNKQLLADEFLQASLLPGVSRTFALTIPQLPPELRNVVTCAYLLCRIADTIEDDDRLSATEKQALHDEFIAVTEGSIPGDELAKKIDDGLSSSTPQAERDLIKEIPAVVRCLLSYNERQRASLQRCIRIMSQGMPTFQREASSTGLANIAELERYCYYVAGVVGEMLTELFCDYSPEIDKHRDELMALSVDFGLALQMTNILKDQWDDQKRHVSWLPRDLFAAHDIKLSEYKAENFQENYAKALSHLIGLTRFRLEQALQYTALLPARETGIRRFCLWAIALAVLTLKNIHRNPQFTSGQQVKVSRPVVKKTIAICNLSCRSNFLLKKLFDWAARGLPLTQPGALTEVPAKSKEYLNQASQLSND